MKRVVVLGGTGFLGRHVCEKLIRAGYSVTVPTRRLTNARAVQMLPGLQAVACDVHNAAQLAQVLAGHDAVINLVAILHGSATAFEHVHVELPRKLAAACASAGVHRVVHVSALGADAQGPSLYQRSKAAGEAVLREAGLALTVLRPSVIFGAEDRFLNVFARLQALAPLMPVAGATTRFQPVWVEDVARALVVTLPAREAVDRVYEACGPDIWTLADIVRLAGRCIGHVRPVIALPLWLGHLQATLMEWLPGEPLMSRDNVASLSVDNVSTGKLPGLLALGITPASLAAVAPTYMGLRGPRSALDALRRDARRGST